MTSKEKTKVSTNKFKPLVMDKAIVYIPNSLETLGRTMMKGQTTGLEMTSEMFQAIGRNIISNLNYNKKR
jgi:hypothetical protein